MTAGIVSRRDVLRLCATGGASFLLGDVMSGAQRLVPARNAVDHLLLGVSDLDKGMDWVEQRTGVRAVIGGSHPGVGTRNALLSLGGRQYLEIIAPDPAQATFNARTDVRKLAEPRLIGWAAVTTDINSLAKKVRDGGQQVFGPRDGSRARPDGKMIRWKTLGILTDLSQDGVDPIPFFIEWEGGSVHPSQDSPKGCELRSLDLEGPNPAAITATLTAVGIEANVKQAPATSLSVMLSTSRGNLELR